MKSTKRLILEDPRLRRPEEIQYPLDAEYPQSEYDEKNLHGCWNFAADHLITMRVVTHKVHGKDQSSYKQEPLERSISALNALNLCTLTGGGAYYGPMKESCSSGSVDNGTTTKSFDSLPKEDPLTEDTGNVCWFSFGVLEDTSLDPLDGSRCDNPSRDIHHIDGLTTPSAPVLKRKFIGG